MACVREPWLRKLLVVLVAVVGFVLVLSLASRNGVAAAVPQAGALSSWSPHKWLVADKTARWSEAGELSPDADAAAAPCAADAADPSQLPDANSAAVDAFFAEGGQVLGFIFYGRRRYTQVQMPYLLQSRRQDGVLGAGVLSKVIFVANTDDGADLAYLEELQLAHGDYVAIQHPERVAKQGQNNADYCSLYGRMAGHESGAPEGKTLIIKIDDDLLYIGPTALRNLVAAKLRSNHLFVSANVVNHPLLAHVHQRMGLYDEADVESMTNAELSHNQTDVEDLPEDWHFDYGTFSGNGWQSGPHAMLQHLMLLHRLRSLGEVEAAALYGSFRKWDFDALGYSTGRWSINCFVYNPVDLAELDVNACRSVDDEHYLTAVYPEKVGRHCAAAGDALVAHFAYYPQREWLEAHSAVLARYAALSGALQQRLAGTAGELP